MKENILVRGENMKNKTLHEPAIEFIFRISSMITIFAVIMIIVFIISKGIQPFLSGNKDGTYSFTEDTTDISLHRPICHVSESNKLFFMLNKYTP